MHFSTVNGWELKYNFFFPGTTQDSCKSGTSIPLDLLNSLFGALLMFEKIKDLISYSELSVFYLFVTELLKIKSKAKENQLLNKNRYKNYISKQVNFQYLELHVNE